MLEEYKRQIEQTLRCPLCGGEFSLSSDFLRCKNCKQKFPIINGVLILLTEKELRDFCKNSLKDKNHAPRTKARFKKLVEAEDLFKKLRQIMSSLSIPNWQEGFDASWVETKPARQGLRQSLQYVKEKARLKEARFVLDYPTGSGSFIRSALDKIRKDALVFTFDINPFILRRLKKYLTSKNLASNIVFVCSDARKMPLRANKFDSVTGWSALMEMSAADQGFKEAYRVLKKGGYFSASGDIYKEKSPSMEIVKKKGLSVLATPERVEQCLIKTGFKNIDTKIFFAGYDESTLPDKERAPLPARGDWFGYLGVTGRK